MSYSSSRARAMDATRPLAERASHARSCAVVVAEKFRVHRSEVVRKVKDATGVDLTSPSTATEIEAAIVCLDALRLSGL
jgi:hypothetical protein